MEDPQSRSHTILDHSNMSRPGAVYAVGGLLCYTFTRISMISMLKTLKMNGGVNPNGWLGPWFSDSCLGILTPFAIYAAFAGTGPYTWGLLLAFNCIGAFDYSHGLLAQYMHPQVVMVGNAPAVSAAVYGSIGLGLLCQLINIVLLLLPDVVLYFTVTTATDYVHPCTNTSAVATVKAD